VKHPVSTPQQPPPDDHENSAYHDQLDDDYWFDRLFRAPKLVGFLPTERLGKQLQAHASSEYQKRRAEAAPEG
jgi:hypothetical protein